MSWDYRCPECERQTQKHYVLEAWFCACGWFGPVPTDQPKERTKCDSLPMTR